MRGSITLFEDQYQFFKELKSKRLLVAFVEFMFEDIEPTWLNWIEKTIFNSLRIRMENQKKKSLAWKQSHWGWRPRNSSSELDTENNRKTTEQTTEQTTNKQEVEDKDKVIKENKKEKFLEFVYLTEEEYKKLTDSYGVKVIDNEITNLNNYIGQNWKDKYKSHYHTILNRLRRAWIKEIQKPKQLSKYEIEEWVYDINKLI